MNLFGRDMWASGKLNPSNFALNTPLENAKNADKAKPNPTTTDTFVGAPLATGSPSYPTMKLSGTYGDVSNTAKGIALGVGTATAYTATQLGLPWWIAYPLGLGLHIPLAVSIGKDRAV